MDIKSYVERDYCLFHGSPNLWLYSTFPEGKSIMIFLIHIESGHLQYGHLRHTTLAMGRAASLTYFFDLMFARESQSEESWLYEKLFLDRG